MGAESAEDNSEIGGAEDRPGGAMRSGGEHLSASEQAAVVAQLKRERAANRYFSAACRSSDR